MRLSLSEQLKRIAALVVVLFSASLARYIVMGRQEQLQALARMPSDTRGTRKLVTQVE